MNVRPYALIENSLLRRFEQQIGAVVSAWSTDWGVERLANSVTCWRAWETLPQQLEEKWTQSFVHGERRAWLTCSPELLKYIQRQIFPTGQRHVIQSAGPSSIAIEGAQTAVKSLADAVIHIFGMPKAAAMPATDSNPEPQHFKHASGAIVLV